LAGAHWAPSTGRLSCLEADLSDAHWSDEVTAVLVGRPLDVVLTSTALHWITSGTLARLYRDLGQFLRSDGVFLNADHMRFGSARPTLRTMTIDLNAR
jgi:hypothetical protein